MKVKDLKKLMCKKVKDPDFQDLLDAQGLSAIGTDVSVANMSVSSNGTMMLGMQVRRYQPEKFVLSPGTLTRIEGELNDTSSVSNKAIDSKISSSFMSTEVELPKERIVDVKKREKEDIVQEVLRTLKSRERYPYSENKNLYGPIESISRLERNPRIGDRHQERHGVLEQTSQGHAFSYQSSRKKVESRNEDQDLRSSPTGYETRVHLLQPISESKHSSRRVHRPPALIRQRNGGDPYHGNSNRYPYHQRPTHLEDDIPDVMLANLRQRSQQSRQTAGCHSTSHSAIDQPLTQSSKRRSLCSDSVEIGTNLSALELSEAGSVATDGDSAYYSDMGSIGRSVEDFSLDSRSYAYKSIAYDEQSLSSVEMFVDHVLCSPRNRIWAVDWIE